MDSERDDAMSTTRIRIDLDDPGSLPEGRVDYAVLDSTTEADLIAQQREDDAEAMRDGAVCAPGSQGPGNRAERLLAIRPCG